MQKLQRSTFSATQKDALLDQVKLIIDAGEVTVRSDSYHLDSTEVTRYTRAIASLNAQYGWHLDAQKVLSRLGKKLGKKCGGGWISPEKKCKSHYTNGKLNEAGKSSGANLADRVRRRKNMSAIASRDGKLAGGSWDIGAAYRSGKETQSTVLAKRTSPGGKKTSPMTDRVSKMQRIEADRARINWGRTTGDWKQKPDSTAAMDMVKPSPIASGKSLKALFTEADRIAQKYPSAPTFAERRSARQEADRIMEESGARAAVDRASGVATMAPVRIPNQRSSSEPRRRGRSVD